MKSREELWSILETLAEEEGLRLFDVTWPPPRSSVLRVFVSREEKERPIDVEECAALSRRILDHPAVEDLLPGRCTLEVSSPGINRRLRMPWHFQGAVGERVRVTFVECGSDSKRTVTGLLAACDGTRLEIEEERTSRKWEMPLSEVREARVDFLFS